MAQNEEDREKAKLNNMNHGGVPPHRTNQAGTGDGCVYTAYG